MLRLSAVLTLLCAFLTSVLAQPPSQRLPSQGLDPTHEDNLPPRSESSPHVVILHDGQHVILRNIDPIASNKAKPGETVLFEVAGDVESDGVVVIPAHDIAVGRILSAQHAKLAHYGGKLAVAIESVQMANGEFVPLRAVESRKERNFGWRDVGAATAVAATIYYMPLVPVYLLAKGDEVNLAPGSLFNAYVDGDVAADRAALEANVPPAVLHPDLATIYIFRGHNDQSSRLALPVSCGRSFLGDFPRDSYLKLIVATGRYWLYTLGPGVKLSTGQRQKEMMVLDAEAGKTYYLEVAMIKSSWVGNVEGGIHQVDESAGTNGVFAAKTGTELTIPETVLDKARGSLLAARPRGVKN